MDDDIQFLGMVSPISTNKPYSISPNLSLQPPASGIMLVVPKNGDEPTQTLRFLKSSSVVVHIGRASSSLTEAEKSPDSIQFRCPVISRRHAKLMFSSGHVYIVDLNSHHGTHLLRRGDVVPRSIVPDVPIALQDGDTLTFGKAVGKEPYSVSPITANVMLIYDTEAVLSPPPAVQPVISLTDSPTSPTTPIKSKQPAAAPNSSISGRYGLFGPHSPCSQSSSPGSSDEDFSQSDHDIEEDEDEDEDDYYLDPPEEYPSTPFRGHGQAQSTSACYASLPSLHGLGLLASRHVIHHAPPHAHISTHAPHTHLNMHSQMAPSLSLENRSTFDRWFTTQRAAAQDATNMNLEAATDEPMDISRPDSPPVPNLLQDVPPGVIEEAFASVAQTDVQINPNPGEPPIIGAYPGSPIRNVAVSPWVGSEDVEEEPRCGLVPQPSHLQVELENPSPVPQGTAPSSVVAEASEGSEQFAEDVASDIDADGEADVEASPSTAADTAASAALEPSALVASAGVAAHPINTRDQAGVGANAGTSLTIDARLTSLDEALVNLWGNVLRMQIAHRKTQTDHKVLSDRTDALAARVDAVQADLRGALCGDEVEALKARVQTAEDLLAELQGRLSATEAALAEAKAQAEAQVQVAEQGAQEDVTESDVAPVTITPAPTRKRKRTEDTGDEDGCDYVEEEEDQGNTGRTRRQKVRGKKRTRRARAAVQTTAAVVVGAVAAWSALAFT
ncbi:hypothetical protein BJV78DRAFT_1258274 [Lactifluus subvellereus]|nr:hypothetical protein BJV78DRAFT_1258274 [Lactifluus subvellereus]